MCQSNRPFDVLTARTSDHNGAAVVVLAGEVDLMTEAIGLNAALTALDRVPAGLVLDLQAVSFFGSSGINMLLTVHRLAQEQGVPFVVVAANHVVLGPLTVTGVDLYLRLFPNLPAALRDLAVPAVPPQGRTELINREAARGTA